MPKIKHMMSYTTEYRIWGHMKDRCSNPRSHAYPDYGGRGIVVCADWVASFENFFAYLGKRPSRLHTLDRINNDGNYEPGNVRWALPLVQQRNKSNCSMFTYQGIKKPVYVWAEEYGLNVNTIKMRIRSKWSVNAILLTPRKLTNRRSYK